MRKVKIQELPKRQNLGRDISIPDLRRVKVGGLPKAQDGTQIVGGIEYLGDVTQNENNYWDERYKYWRSKNLSYKDAYLAATADVNTQRGPSHPYYVYNSNAFLPNENSGANITAKKPNPYKHLQDWPDFNESGSASDFYGNTDDAARWEKQWYSERAKLPQFKDVAEKRLSLANSIDMQPWSKDNWKNSYSPNAAGYYSWDDATVNIPQSRFSNPLLYTHERSHWYDYNAPQDKTITRYYRKNPLPLYNEYDPILNDIIPIEYTIPGGEGATNDFYSKDSIYTPFKNDDSDYGTDYYYNPTEVRARLNEWRRNHNIDPTKDYSTDEIQQIIDKDINSGNSLNFDLYKVIRGRGDLLKQIHDAYVSTGNKENPNEIPKAKRGLLKAQDGKTIPSISDALETMLGLNKEEEPEESALSYFYNMMTPKPKSGFDYNTYMNHANKYLSRDIFKGSSLTAKDLADAAQDFYNTTNYVYPVDLLLAQGQMESKLGKTLKSQHNYFNVGNTDEGATRNFKSGKDSALNYMNLMYNDYLNKGQKTPEQLLAPNGFVNYAGKRYASNPNYEKEVGDQRAFIKKYLGIQKEGGSLPEAQFGLGDKIFKKRVLNKYPAMQNVYGPKGENLNIIKDKNFKASDYGYGDIEFIFPGDGSVTYSDDYTYQSPTPNKYTAVYNPKGARRGDVFLDMLHGMRNDPGYEQLLQNFGNTVKDTRGDDMRYFYEKSLLEGYAGDGQERWDENYIDGLLRSELYKSAPGRVSAKKDYEIERGESSPQMQAAAKDIYDYLRTGPKKLSQEKQGGAVKKVKINSLPNNWKTK